MYIKDISEGVKITVESTDKEFTLRFETFVLTLDKDEDVKGIEKYKKTHGEFFIVTNPIYSDGKLVNFNIEGTESSINFLDNGKYYKIKGCTIKHMSMPSGSIVTLIESTNESNQINRRDNFRVPLSRTITAQIGAHSKAVSCTLVDLSVGGVGIMVPEDTDANIGDTVSFILNDTKYSITARITCVVVRVSDDEHRKLLGCTMNSYSAKLGNYLNKLQADRGKVKSKGD